MKPSKINRLNIFTMFYKSSITIPSPQSRWSGKVTCFKSNPVECTLLARWDENYQDPWLIVTDLEPEDADISMVFAVGI